MYAAYRFGAKLRAYKPLLDACLDRVTASLGERFPTWAATWQSTGPTMPAYANGQRFVAKAGRERADSEFSDQDASWDHRSAVSTRKGGGFYGDKLHAAVCTATGRPLAWSVETTRTRRRTSRSGWSMRRALAGSPP